MSATQGQVPASPRWFTLLKDFVALTFPWVLIFKQAGIIFDPPAEISEPILWLAGGLLGVPGIGAIWAARSGGGSPATTTGSPSGSPPVASPSSPSSSPASGAEA